MNGATSDSAPHRPARPRPAGGRPRTLAALAAALTAALAAALLLGPAHPAAAGPDASGETVSLTGSTPGARLDVTLTQVADPAGPAPGDAERLVSVRLRLENTGTAGYEDSPAASTHLLDCEGRRFTGLHVSTEAGAAFPATVSLEPGSTASGFVTFRLPKDAGLAAVQFALDGGLANDVGQWSLP